MRIGDRVMAIVSAVEVATGTIVGMETGAAIVEFHPYKPFSIPDRQMIPVRAGSWKVYFNAKSDLVEGKI
jgi:hypothetical protein